MKVLESLCPNGVKKDDLEPYEANMLAIWRVIPEGKAYEGGELRDTHDEDGTPLIGPYRGRHIVDGFGNPICEFIHDEKHAWLIAAAPHLMAALERCVEQIEQMRGLFDDSDCAIQNALDSAEYAMKSATEGMV